MKYNFKIIFLILLFSLSVPFSAKAITFGPPFGTESSEKLIDTIANFIFWVAMAIVPVMIIVAGYYFLTSGGEPEKIRTAKRIIFWTIVGFVIVLLAREIISIIESIRR
jgi:membrane protease YdiL (CAAX protease family)